MNALIKWLLFRLLSRPIVYAVGWTEDERRMFEQFCRSLAGQKFLEWLRQTVARTTFNAVYQSEVSANAYARGQQDILALFMKLQVFPEQEAESSGVGEIEQTYARGAPRRNNGSDDWRWIGGGGAIG